MAVANSVQKLTQAEYLDLERRAESKSEFLDGEMFAMSGGTKAHSLIAVNIATALHNALQDSRCRVYNSDMRVKVELAGLYTYPDVTLACSEEQMEDEHDDTLLNPSVIFEVLSDSREAYDRGKKFEMYRRLASLQEYILVSQVKPLVEQFVRQGDGAWLLREVAGFESHLTLPSVGVSIKLSEIYAGLKSVRDPRQTGEKPGAV